MLCIQGPVSMVVSYHHLNEGNCRLMSWSLGDLQDSTDTSGSSQVRSEGGFRLALP